MLSFTSAGKLFNRSARSYMVLPLVLRTGSVEDYASCSGKFFYESKKWTDFFHKTKMLPLKFSVVEMIALSCTQ